MRALIKYFVPPAIMPLIALLFAIFVAFDWAHTSSQIIDGHPDNAPWQGSQLLFLFGVIIYLPLLVINCVCLKIGQSSPRRLFGSYFVAMIICALLVDSHNLISGTNIFLTLGFGLIFSTFLILPMALISWAGKCWEEKQLLK
jgi:hypothetical protein